MDWKTRCDPNLKVKTIPSSNSSGGAAITGVSTQTSNSATAGGVSRIGGVSSSSQVYANMHSMPELNVAAETGESPETSSGANSHDRKSSGGSVMTSSATQEAETTTSAVSHWPIEIHDTKTTTCKLRTDWLPHCGLHLGCEADRQGLVTMPTADLWGVVTKATRLVTVGYRKLSPSFTHLPTPKINPPEASVGCSAALWGNQGNVTHN